MSEKVKNILKILGIYCGTSFILWSLFVIIALVWFDRCYTNFSEVIRAIGYCLITPVCLLFLILISHLPAIIILYFLFKKYQDKNIRIASTVLTIPLMNFIYLVIGNVFSDFINFLSLIVFGYTLILFLPTVLVVAFCIPKTLLTIKTETIKTIFYMMFSYVIIFYWGALAIDYTERVYTLSKLEKYEPLIEQIEEYKSKNGIYPVNIEDTIKKFPHFKYEPYSDGSNYVLKVSDNDLWNIEYNYCSDKEDEYCKTGWHNHSNNSKLGEWTKSEDDD